MNDAADVNAFLVVFVLPLNSAVNPILYTFTTTKYRNQVLLRGWKKITSKKWHRNEGSGHTGSGHTGHTGSGSNQGKTITNYSFIYLFNNEGIIFFWLRCIYYRSIDEFIFVAKSKGRWTIAIKLTDKLMLKMRGFTHISSDLIRWRSKKHCLFFQQQQNNWIMSLAISQEIRDLRKYMYCDKYHLLDITSDEHRRETELNMRRIDTRFDRFMNYVFD